MKRMQDNSDRYFPDCYAHRRKIAPTLSAESQPTMSKLGYYNSYYM